MSIKERRWEGVTAVTLGLISLWFLLWLFTADRFWWMAMLNRGVPALFIPSLLLAILFVLKQRWRWAGMAALPLLLFAWIYRPYLLPQLNPQQGQTVLQVMSYNVLFSNQNADAVAEVIHSHAPDLVALQEVRPRMMAELQQRLADEYPYSLMGTRHEYGTTAVFSRVPFLEQEILDLGDDRPAAIVTIEKGGEQVTFTAVHLRAYGLRWVPWAQIPSAISERTRLQNQQAEILLAALAGREGSIIIGCDCNSQESASSYRLLNEMFANAAHQTTQLSPPGTIPDRHLQHIDYILYRGNLTANGVFIIQSSGGSDHHAILATFR